MAILQISKIQQRSGNLVDLPQLDDAEFGWANDAKRLFIGKTSPNENIEILTSYSQISFSQLDGSVGNLNISNTTIADGQILAFDGTNWVNKGGDVGGLITLGDVGNVKLTGGAVGYVLQTDGLGNLSWTPKGTIVAGILNVTKANPAVVTTVSDSFFTNGAQITIVDPQGMTELSGNIYYANVLTSTTFRLYTGFDGANFSGAVNSTSYNAYSYTTVSATTVSTNVITVANSSPFTANAAVKFIGNMSTSGITANTIYYVLGTPPSGTTIKIATSPDSNASNVVPLQTTSGLTAQVYQVGGEAVSTLGSSVTFSPAGGTDTQIQYNETGSLQGSGLFTYDYGSSILTLVGNANVTNLNATGVTTASRFISNVATGTAPLTVTSTTRVSNLNVSYSNVSDFGVVTAATTGTFYPVFVSGNSTANYALASNANISFNAATGNLSVTLLNVTSNLSANNGAIGNLLTVGANANITGNLNVTANANIGTNLHLTGAAFLGANANITGNLNVTANANITANLAANNAAVGNLLTVGANANVTGNVNVTANISANNGAIGNLLTVGANANVTGNLNVTANANITGNVTASRLVSNIATGTAPIQVTSTTRVANLSVAYANVSDFAVVTSQSTGIYYPVFVSGSSTANYALAANSGISANIANGTIIATTVVGNLTGNVTGNVSGNISGTFVAPGSNTQALFNDDGNVNASSGFTFNKSTNLLTVTGNISGGNLTTAGALSVTGNANVGNLGTAGLIAATGNVSGGNITTLGVVSATGNVSGGNLTTSGVVAATGNVSGGNLTTANTVTANTVTASGNVNGANVVATSYHIRSIDAAVSAAGTTQGTATVLAKEINVVSTVASGAGVALPIAVAGMVLIINNTSANTLNVYPATGGAINSGSTNAAYSHTSGASIQYYATSSSQWYTVGATFS